MLPQHSPLSKPNASLCDRLCAGITQVVRLKRESFADPTRLSAGMALPAPLARASNHLASLSFEADPDYALLRQCLDDLVNSNVRMPVETLLGSVNKCHGTVCCSAWLSVMAHATLIWYLQSSHLVRSNPSLVPQATGLQSKPSGLQPNGVAAHGARFTGLEEIADTPLSPIEDIADTPKSPPPEDAAPPASRPTSAGILVWQE
jgi:hypothetical protein